MKLPDRERAVQTTAPMSRATPMPSVPLRPAPIRMTLPRMIVIRVMPETGFVPTMAMALAATVANRKDRRRQRTTPIRANLTLEIQRK